MSVPSPRPIVSVMDVLRDCGWVPDADRPWSEEPALKYNFGNFELSASVLTNRYFHQIVSFDGYYRDQRSMLQISFGVPVRIESREQVLAWIVYGMRHVVRLATTPAWIEEGRCLKHLLPWEKHMAAYRSRPQATIDRMWMKPLGKVLREAAESAAEEESCRIHFDGTTVRFELPGQIYVVQGGGAAPWAEAAIVALRDLAGLPQRWMRAEIGVSLWEERLTIGNRVFAATLVPTTAGRVINEGDGT